MRIDPRRVAVAFAAVRAFLHLYAPQAVVPVHDPSLITTHPTRLEWYHHEGIGHLSVEAFWQMSKVVEVGCDRFLEAGDQRADPLAGV